MTKQIKNIAICVLLIVSIVMSMYSYSLYIKNKEMREQMANDNLNNWRTILLMTERVRDNVKSLEDIEKYLLYQNVVIYTVSDKLSPAFYSNTAKNGFGFLRTGYDALMQYLYIESKKEVVSKEVLLSGLELYWEMNTDLYDICMFVVSSAEDDKHDKHNLLKADSAINKDVQIKIDDYCIKYNERIQNYFGQVSKPKPTN